MPQVPLCSYASTALESSSKLIFFLPLSHLVQWPKPGREALRLGLLWGLSIPSTTLGRLLCYRICLQVRGFPLICWIKPRHSSLPMLGLCHLQRLCQSKGRAVQAHIRIHTTAYEKVSRLCFLCCRHCIIGLCGVFFLVKFIESACFFFSGQQSRFWVSHWLLWPIVPEGAHKHVTGRGWSSVCSDLQCLDLHLHLEVLISEFKFIPLCLQGSCKQCFKAVLLKL